MTADHRTRAVAATIAHLEWCATIPHTIDQIIGIHAERTSATTRPMRHGMTNDEILSTLTSRTGSGGKGGHSDPTARAALWGEPDAPDTDDIATVRAAVTRCADAARTIGDTCAATLGHAPWRPPAPVGLTGTVTTAIARIHRWAPDLEPTAELLHGSDLAALDALVRTELADTAGWLHDKAEAIWAEHRGEQRQPAVQRPLVACRVHARWVNDPPTAIGAKGLCSRCEEFQDRYSCEPTEAIVRRWDYGAAATPGQIAEAKAPKRTGRKRGGA